MDTAVDIARKLLCDHANMAKAAHQDAIGHRARWGGMANPGYIAHEFEARDRHLRIARRWRDVVRAESGGAL